MCITHKNGIGQWIEMNVGGLLHFELDKMINNSETILSLLMPFRYEYDSKSNRQSISSTIQSSNAFNMIFDNSAKHSLCASVPFGEFQIESLNIWKKISKCNDDTEV